jgi:hypothetical protein
MSLPSKLKALSKLVGSFVRHPSLSVRTLRGLPESVRAYVYAEGWRCSTANQTNTPAPGAEVPLDSRNPLREYFDAHETGRGIWKWTHYFEIYHRHFSKFIGREVHVVEVGVYSGGSLDMWKEYFGPDCRVYGVDIEPACKAYEDDRTQILIGDQADPKFWQRFREQVRSVDILVDDGGHLPEQQIVTLEEMLPHLRHGGVYLCEDIHAFHNRFAAYVSAFADRINAAPNGEASTDFQRSIHSVHLYPYVTVIEKCSCPREKLVAPRHGTEWQPFLQGA